MKDLIANFYGTLLRLINRSNLQNNILTDFTYSNIYKLSIDTKFKDSIILDFRINSNLCYKFDDNMLKVFKFFINSGPRTKLSVDLSVISNLSLNDIENIYDDYKDECDLFLTLKYGKKLDIISQGHTLRQEESLRQFTMLMNKAILLGTE